MNPVHHINICVSRSYRKNKLQCHVALLHMKRKVGNASHAVVSGSTGVVLYTKVYEAH